MNTHIICCLLAAVFSLQLSSLNAFAPAITCSPHNYDSAAVSDASSSTTALFGFTRKNNKVDKKPKRKATSGQKKLDPSFKKLNPENDMMTNHQYRLSTAGKVGTQRYADPTMVFIANLNFTTTEDQLKEFLLPLVPSPWDIAKIQIVRDWKTGDSKGYAFVRFTQPVFATLCIHQMHNQELLGRTIQVKAANSKSESPLRKQQREEQMRLKALRRAENPPPPPPPPKPENPEFLAYLDKDLVTEADWIAAAADDEYGMDEEDDGDDDDEVDGWEDPDAPAPKGFG